MKHLRRLRNWFLWVVPLTVLLVMYRFDPDNGLSLMVWLSSFSRAFLFVACAHLARKVFFDYPESDVKRLFDMARNTPVGAGLALIAVMIFLGFAMLTFSSAARGQDARTYIPPQAYAYLPLLKVERLRYWADHPRPGVLGALIEHESGCFSMPRKCWNPKSRLKTSREEGAGLGQITRAYRPDGSQRFDALAEAVAAHPELSGWSWANAYDRPDFQLRAVVLKVHDEFSFFKRLTADPLAFADAAYNGGRGGVQKERQACGLAPGCDPQRWFGHVERHCMKSRTALYGQRSACDINRHHVEDVLVVRPNKYEGLT